MSELKVPEGEKRLKPSPDPWILRAIEHIKKPGPTPWISISSIASHISEDQMKEIVMQGIDSEIKYMQECLEITKMALAKPGTEPWKLLDIIAKPGPTPWKLIGSIASYIPENQLGPIVMQGIDSEIKYLQDGIATRKMIYDTLNPRPEPPKTQK